MNISVVIPNYNGANYIKRCIESVKHQTVSTEIIVVDNGSNDESLSIIKKHTDVKIVTLSQNYGFSYAVNRGIEATNGDYIVLLNNDCFLEKDWVEQVYKTIISDKNIFSCCSKMINENNHRLLDDVGDYYNILGWAFQMGNGKSSNLFEQKAEVFSTCAGASIYRKSIFKEIGLFDEQFFAYLEDVDIGYRARIFGYKNVYCPKARCYHIGSATSGGVYNSFKIKYSARNNIYLIYKNMPYIQLMINLPFLLLGIIIKYMSYYSKGFGRVYRNAIVEGIITMRKMKKSRCDYNNLKNYFKIQVELVNNFFKFLKHKATKK
jgi:GT2 family glycosyltransferase